MADHPVRREAKELTPHEEQEWGEKAHELEQRIIGLLQEGRKVWWKLAEACYEFDALHGYYGLKYESRKEWLGQAEIGMSMSYWTRLVDAWEQLVVRRRIKPARLERLESSKVAIVLPKLKQEHTDPEEALDDAEALSVSDLRDKYFGENRATSHDLKERKEVLSVDEAPTQADEVMTDEVMTPEVTTPEVVSVSKVDGEVMTVEPPEVVLEEMLDELLAVAEDVHNASASGSSFLSAGTVRLLDVFLTRLEQGANDGGE